MVWPRVSILWVNYNSMRIMDIVERSLKAIAGLDYPNYELLVVDNGSTDGSYQEVKRIAEKLPIDKKVIRLERNLGFTGGNNVAYRARDPDSRYVVLLNNDTIPFQESLRELVECVESLENVAAVQGIIVDMDTKTVDTAGGILTEFLVAYQLYHGRAPSSVRRHFYVSYADGAYSLYRVDAVRRATGYTDKLFEDEMFAYFDDNVLGLQLWNRGFRVASCPIIAGLHRRSSTFGHVPPFKLYLMTRGYFALNEICNSRYKRLIKLLFPRKMVTSTIAFFLASKLFGERYKSGSSARRLFRAIYKGYLDGVKWGRKKLREMGAPINLYRAPLIEEPAFTAICKLVTGFGIEYFRRFYTELVTRRFEREVYRFVVD